MRITVTEITPTGSYIYDLDFPNFAAAVVAAKGLANKYAMQDGPPIMIAARKLHKDDILEERIFIARA